MVHGALRRGVAGESGAGGYGAVIEDPEGQVVARLSEFLGRQTNNYAEYKGLLAVLEWALENGVRRLRVVSDSELMVRQMKGRYKVKSPAAAAVGGSATPARLEGLRCGTRCAAGTKRRTGWRMRRWTRGWAAVERVSRPAGNIREQAAPAMAGSGVMDEGHLDEGTSGC